MVEVNLVLGVFVNFMIFRLRGRTRVAEKQLSLSLDGMMDELEKITSVKGKTTNSNGNINNSVEAKLKICIPDFGNIRFFNEQHAFAIKAWYKHCQQIYLIN